MQLTKGCAKGFSRSHVHLGRYEMFLTMCLLSSLQIGFARRTEPYSVQGKRQQILRRIICIYPRLYHSMATIALLLM